MFGKNAGSMEAYARGVKDPWVAWVFENLFLPEVPVWFVGMLLGLIAGRQMGLMEGGSSGFVKPIEERFKNLGGHINYGATVEENLVEEDTAEGILLDCGETYRADAVVSAADGYRTIFKMLGGRYLDQKIEKRYKEWKLIRPLVMVNFGVDREFEGDPWLTAIKLERPLKEGARSVDSLMVRLFNYSREFAPPGKTVVQATYETEWEFWRDLHSDRKKYEAEKERISGEIKDRLESFYPGISSRIEMTDVATPHTTWRYTLNHRGAYEGWLPEPRVINTTIQRTLPGLNNFYMAGQWVMPGGGVPTCIVSGRHVVQILCRQDGKRFTTSLP
jgi:phytoene dehydrogenase-like protein